ncbi:T9SS type A sorting domain-containing protein [candidate division KSB1 bacterium]|nr:T9SS type A sorting domain-containing protein [candidate division KSB1 bacterium]
MSFKKLVLIFFCIWFNYNSLFARLESISFQLINGRGTTEKLDHVYITLTLNNQVIGREFTDNSGHFQLNFKTGIASDNHVLQNFFLPPNYPNPFSGTTTFPLILNRKSHVVLDIFNILGQRVRRITEQSFLPGEHHLFWDGKNETGEFCGFGTYFYRFKIDNQIKTGKMCLLNSSLSMNIPASGALQTLSKIQTFDELKIQISDRDVEEMTAIYMIPSDSTSLNLGEIKVHVYPFARIRPDTLSVMAGQSISDILNIYHEKSIQISSSDCVVDWNYTSDSLITITYENIEKPKILLKIQEINSPKIVYLTVLFNLSLRPGLSGKNLRRGYLNIPYKDQLRFENNQGDVEFQLLSQVPDGLIYENGAFQGTPLVLFEALLHFQLMDSRKIWVTDSIFLFIRQPFDIDFNEYGVEILESYPRDGTHPYSWVDTYEGVTRDLYYKGVRIARANPNGSKSCYCCGLTFEDFLRSIQQLNSDLGKNEDINKMTATDLRYFLRLWFVENTWGDGPGVALKAFGLGDRIGDFAKARPGDYVQFWRTTGSGHSVIFINWQTDSKGEITGLRYWSTQSSTRGVNYNIENFSGQGGTINPAMVYISRVRSPEKFTPFNRNTLQKAMSGIDLDRIILPGDFMEN